MSYDLSLKDPVTGETMHAKEWHAEMGGTHAVGGTTELWFNITYNYAPHFCKVLGPQGIREIYGMTGTQSLPVLAEAASKLGDDVDGNYWQSTEGNARAALYGLIRLATLGPKGVWDGD